MGRTIIRGFINGDIRPLNELNLNEKDVVRVWTIIDENKHKFSPTTGEVVNIDSEDAHLRHLENVFLEDHFHDWRISEGRLHFYGHSGNRGSSHDLLIEWK